MTESSELEAIQVYEQELVAFADALRELHVSRGARPYREVEAAARTAGRVTLSTSAVSEALAGKRLPSLDFTLELVRQIAGDDRELREQWQGRWRNVKIHQRRASTFRKTTRRTSNLKSEEEKPAHTFQLLAGHSEKIISNARREAEEIIEAARSEAEKLLETARVQADEMLQAASDQLLAAGEQKLTSAAARLRIRESLRIILVGPPGGGKGTQAPFISQQLDISYIRLGELFRKNVSGGTRIGTQVKRFMEAGKLVPDEVTMAMLFKHFEEDSVYDGFILDGIPRNLNQADLLDEFFAVEGKKIDVALHIDIPRKESFKRLAGRRVCTQDGSHVSHTIYTPPKRYGICDVCGANLALRVDDTRDVIRKRWEVWETEFQHVNRKYGGEGRLITIHGLGPVADVTARAIDALAAYFG
ncbi:nucleoside monophosphate kinase [Streptomyces sp. NPDC050315]|uniref:nucleoside monophosphate kinase n=1 Tax=Streptomyces sp. NPDC050315 TaxID=3155039 RepID=UPI00343C00BA